MEWVTEAATATTVGRLVVLVMLLVTGGVLARAVSLRAHYDQLDERLFLGVPWGTLLAASAILAVYLFVQNGLSSWQEPVTIPYVARSYFDPFGMVVGPFAHQDPGHLIGNLTALLVVGPIAEYIYGHHEGSRFGPVGRVSLFVGALFAVGLATSLFSWTNLIGFSGVTFALAGFVLVRYPILSVLAVVFRELVSEIVRAIEDPILTPSEVGATAQWFDIAIQGHAFGFLLGVLCGIALLRRRNEQPASFERLWLGALLVISSKSLWAWWVPGIDGAVVYPGLGIGLVLASSLLIARAVHTGEERLLGWWTWSEVATATLVAVLLFAAVLAVPAHLTTVDGGERNESVQVDEYTVSYEEEPAVRTTQAGEVPNVFASESSDEGGVVVVNDEREFWTIAATEDELEATGEATVRVGGVGWAETIDVERNGWETGGETVYTIHVTATDRPPEQVYTSDSAKADAVVDGREIIIESGEHPFVLVVEGENGGSERVSVPEEGRSVSASGVEIHHEDDRLIASDGENQTVIATQEEYD